MLYCLSGNTCDIITFLIYIMRKRKHLWNEKRFSKKYHAILLYFEKPFKWAAIIFYFIISHFKYGSSKFSKNLLHMSIDLDAGKVECMLQQNQYNICAYNYCFSSTSYIRLVMKLMKLTEAWNLVDFSNNTR